MLLAAEELARRTRLYGSNSRSNVREGAHRFYLANATSRTSQASRSSLTDLSQVAVVDVEYEAPDLGCVDEGLACRVSSVERTSSSIAR